MKPQATIFNFESSSRKKIVIYFLKVVVVFFLPCKYLRSKPPNLFGDEKSITSSKN